VVASSARVTVAVFIFVSPFVSRLDELFKQHSACRIT